MQDLYSMSPVFFSFSDDIPSNRFVNKMKKRGENWLSGFSRFVNKTGKTGHFVFDFVFVLG